MGLVVILLISMYCCQQEKLQVCPAMSDASIKIFIESIQDHWRDPILSQLSRVVKTLPYLFGLRLRMYRLCQILRDVPTQILKATHPLHCCLIEVKGGVGLLLPPNEVYYQVLLTFS